MFSPSFGEFAYCQLAVSSWNVAGIAEVAWVEAASEDVLTGNDEAAAGQGNCDNLHAVSYWAAVGAGTK